MTSTPVVGKILDYRGVKKLLSTYIEALPDLAPRWKIPKYVLQPDHSRHGSPLQQQPPTLQNIPHPYARGRAIREAFVPDAGCTFLSADYSQIELRLMAHFSEDPASSRPSARGKTSIRLPQRRSTASCPRRSHPTCVAARRPRTSVSSTASPPSALASVSPSPRKEAKELIDGYFASYPGVANYMSRVVEEAKHRGYVTTLLDRRRSLPDINSANAVVRGYAERNAINAPLQGSAADLIKIAMIRLDAAIREQGLKSRMILQVHDELNFNVPTDELAEMTELVRSTMESVYPDLRVPLEVSIGHGPTCSMRTKPLATDLYSTTTE